MQTRISADVDAAYKGRDSDTLTSLTLYAISDSNCTVSSVSVLVRSGVLKQQPVMPKLCVFFNLENPQPAVDATVQWGQC